MTLFPPWIVCDATTNAALHRIALTQARLPVCGGPPGRVHTGRNGALLALGDERRAFAASLATEARQLGAVLGVALTTAGGFVGYRASLVEHDRFLVYGFRAAALVAATICGLAAVAVWRWMPARNLKAPEHAPRQR
jgi:hypothetical protein